VGSGNVVFDGPGEDEDFGLEQLTGNPADRYRFRTSPLRNAALQPAFFHNGAFTRIEDAIRHHLDVLQSVRQYDPVAAGVASDLTQRIGPMAQVLECLDPLLAAPLNLSRPEFEDLLHFVRDALLDPRAETHELCGLVPPAVPSGEPTLTFERCRSAH
jgi:cytochrome c peroxidase